MLTTSVSWTGLQTKQRMSTACMLTFDNTFAQSRMTWKSLFLPSTYTRFEQHPNFDTPTRILTLMLFLLTHSNALSTPFDRQQPRLKNKPLDFSLARSSRNCQRGKNGNKVKQNNSISSTTHRCSETLSLHQSIRTPSFSDHTGNATSSDVAPGEPDSVATAPNMPHHCSTSQLSPTHLVSNIPSSDSFSQLQQA